MHDQRMVGGPALGGEDLRHRGVVVGARAEAVDGLGRKRDQLAARRSIAPPVDTRAASLPARIGIASSGRGSKPSSASSLAARSRARCSPTSRAVTVRCPILRPRRAERLPYRCRCAPGSASTLSPRRRALARRARVEPQVAEQVQHHRRRMQARRSQRQAGQRAHLQLELRDVAGVDRVVARVVRARRHLVGDAARRPPARRTRRTARRRIASRRGDALGRGDTRAARSRRRHAARRHARSPRGCRRGAGCAATGKCTQLARRVARDDHAQLARRAAAVARARSGERPSSPQAAASSARVATRPGPCRRSRACAVFRMPGSSVGIDGVRAAHRVSITACGAHGTPQRANCAFSAARSWQIATASAPGATGRVRAERDAAPAPARSRTRW